MQQILPQELCDSSFQHNPELEDNSQNQILNSPQTYKKLHIKQQISALNMFAENDQQFQQEEKEQFTFQSSRDVINSPHDITQGQKQQTDGYEEMPNNIGQQPYIQELEGIKEVVNPQQIYQQQNPLQSSLPQGQNSFHEHNQLDFSPQFSSFEDIFLRNNNSLSDFQLENSQNEGGQVIQCENSQLQNTQSNDIAPDYAGQHVHSQEEKNFLQQQQQETSPLLSPRAFGSQLFSNSLNELTCSKRNYFQDGETYNSTRQQLQVAEQQLQTSNQDEQQQQVEEQKQKDMPPSPQNLKFSKQGAKSRRKSKKKTQKNKKQPNKNPIKYKKIVEFIIKIKELNTKYTSKQEFRDILGNFDKDNKFYIPNPSEFALQDGQILNIGKIIEQFTNIKDNKRSTKLNREQSKVLKEFIIKYCDGKEEVNYTELSEQLESQNIAFFRRTVYRKVEKLGLFISKERKKNEKIDSKIKERQKKQKSQELKVVYIDGKCYLIMNMKSVLQ